MNAYVQMYVNQYNEANERLVHLLANVPVDQKAQIFDAIHKLEYATEKLSYHDGVMAERNEIFVDSNTNLPEFMKGDSE